MFIGSLRRERRATAILVAAVTGAVLSCGDQALEPGEQHPIAPERFTCDDLHSPDYIACGGVGGAGGDSLYVMWNWRFPEPGLNPTELSAPLGAALDTLIELQIHVDSGNAPRRPNQTVTISATAIDAAGAAADEPYGHFHRGISGAPKPAGVFLPSRLSQVTINMGADGVESVSFLTSSVSGPVVLRAESQGAKPAVDTVPVGVFGLVQLVPGPTFDTVSPTTIHPSSNWVTRRMHDALTTLADSFHSKFQKKLGFNDASLPFGGKFDLHRQWGADDAECIYRPTERPARPLPRGCHSKHRLGREVDLRSRGFARAESLFVRTLWFESARTHVLIEGDHFHLPLGE